MSQSLFVCKQLNGFKQSEWLNSSIWPIDRILTGTTTLAHSEPDSDKELKAIIRSPPPALKKKKKITNEQTKNCKILLWKAYGKMFIEMVGWFYGMSTPIRLFSAEVSLFL